MNENSHLDKDGMGDDLFGILSTRSNQQIYLLVDVVLYEDFWSFWSSFQPKAQSSWCYLFQDSPYDDSRSTSPILVLIDEGQAGETLYYWLLERSAFFSKACMLIKSTLSLHELRYFWLPRMTAIYPNGEGYLFASYSSPLLAIFWFTLSVNEQANFLGEYTDIYLPTSLFLSEKKTCDKASESDGCFTVLMVSNHIVAPTKAVFSIDSPYILSDSQYERLTREERRHRMVNDIFLRLSQYVSFALNIEHLSALYFNSIELAKKRCPGERDFSFETFAAYRFVLENDYFEEPAFKALLSKYDLRTCIQMFTELNPPIYDEIFREKQTLWLTDAEEGSNET